MMERTHTSKLCKSQADRLRAATGLEYQTLERIALALALQDPPDHIRSREDDRQGRHFEYEHLDRFGGREVARGLLSILHHLPMRDGELMEFVRRAINHGMDKLAGLFETCGENWDQLLRRLDPGTGEHEDNRPSPEFAVAPVDLLVSHEPPREPVRWSFNRESGDQTNGNTAIIGIPGTGKSQFLMSVLWQICRSASDAGFLLLDYKGDLSTNERFVSATRASVIAPDRMPIPLNPLVIPPHVSPLLIPDAVGELFRSFQPKLGEVQKNLLASAYRGLIESQATPTFSGLMERLEAGYSDEGRRSDIVTGLVGQLATLRLFTDDPAPATAELLGRRLILDLSRLEGVRELTAFLVLHAYALLVRGLPDSTIDSGTQRRRARAVIAVDEAHHYLRRKSPPMLKLVREGRSKGVSVILASQSPDDFRGQPEYEELLGNTFAFRLGQPPSPRTLAGTFHVDSRTAKALADQLVALDQFEAVTTLRGQDGRRVSRLRLLPFWQALQRLDSFDHGPNDSINTNIQS